MEKEDGGEEMALYDENECVSMWYQVNGMKEIQKTLYFIFLKNNAVKIGCDGIV